MANRKSVRALTNGEQTEFIDAVLALKSEFQSVDGLSTYNRYVLWHQMAMWQATPLGGDGANTRRNFAHRGPAFLPWHREFLYRFEKDLQRVSGNPNLGLPYWDWEMDGTKPLNDQPIQPVWSLVGGSGVPVNVGLADPIFIVADGPFGIPIAELADPDTFRPDNPRLTLTVQQEIINGRVRVTMRRSVLMRNLGANPIAPSLPNASDVQASLSVGAYDEFPWNEAVDNAGSFRNTLEGWPGAGQAPLGLHNRVHVWVGGSMGPGTSPNDPVFFLHHCNVDRIWSKWVPSGGNPAYSPLQGGPFGHSPSDPMFPWDGRTLPEIVTVEQGGDPSDTAYVEPPSS